MTRGHGGNRLRCLREVSGPRPTVHGGSSSMHSGSMNKESGSVGCNNSYQDSRVNHSMSTCIHSIHCLLTVNDWVNTDISSLAGIHANLLSAF